MVVGGLPLYFVEHNCKRFGLVAVVDGIADELLLLDHGLLLADEEAELCTGYCMSDNGHAEHLVPLGDLVGKELQGVE